jgi:hypothetical protein
MPVIVSGYESVYEDFYPLDNIDVVSLRRPLSENWGIV